jgi:hypothetical protein
MHRMNISSEKVGPTAPAKEETIPTYHHPISDEGDMTWCMTWGAMNIKLQLTNSESGTGQCWMFPTVAIWACPPSL